MWWCVGEGWRLCARCCAWSGCGRPTFGNLACSFAPIRCGLGLLRSRFMRGCTSSSTSRGSGLALLGGGSSSHLWILSSFPWPKVRLCFGRAVWCACVGSPGGGCVVCSLAGSPRWMGHVCHGSPQLHCQRRTNRCRRHWLHQILVSRFCRLKAILVPGNWWGHWGHRKKMSWGIDLAGLGATPCLVSRSTPGCCGCCGCGVGGSGGCWYIVSL